MDETKVPNDLHTIAERVQELYNAILGPKLMKKVGIMHRLEITESNVSFLSQKFVDMEDKIMKELNSIKVDNAKNQTRLNALWTIIGTVGGIGLTLILEYIFKK